MAGLESRFDNWQILVLVMEEDIESRYNHLLQAIKRIHAEILVLIILHRENNIFKSIGVLVLIKDRVFWIRFILETTWINEDTQQRRK